MTHVTIYSTLNFNDKSRQINKWGSDNVSIYLIIVIAVNNFGGGEDREGGEEEEEGNDLADVLENDDQDLL